MIKPLHCARQEFGWVTMIGTTTRKHNSCRCAGAGAPQGGKGVAGATPSRGSAPYVES